MVLGSYMAVNPRKEHFKHFSLQVVWNFFVNEITHVRLVFEDRPIGNQYLTFDWVNWLCPLDKFKVTVIKVSLIALIILSQTKYNCLTFDVPVENKDVSIFHYRNESFNFAKRRNHRSHRI